MADFLELPQGVELFDSVINKKKAELSNTAVAKKELYQPNLYRNAEMAGIPTPSFVQPEMATQQYLQDIEALVNSQVEEIPKSGLETLLGTTFTPGQRQVAETFGSAFTAGAMIGDMVLSTPNLLANTAEAIAAGVLSPENAKQAANNLSKFKQTFEIMDIMGDKVVEKTQRFYGTSTKEAFQRDAQKAWRQGNGFFDVLANGVSAIADNKLGSAQVAIESIPQIIMLARKGVPFAVAFLGIMDQQVKESQEIYRRTYGKEATGGDFLNMVGAAVVSTGVETLESRFLLGKLRPPTTRISNALNKIPYLKPALGTITGGAAEFAQEGFASTMAYLGGKQTFDALFGQEIWENAYVAGVMGAGAGAATRGVTAIPETALDTGRVVSGAQNLVSRGVERLTPSPDTRMNTAAETGDNLAYINAALEKDLTSFGSVEERQAHVKSIITAAQGLTPRQQLDLGEQKLLELSQKIQTVVQEAQRLNDIENNVTTVDEAQTIIRQNASDPNAISRIVRAIEDGTDVTPSTISSIKGSNIFETLGTTDKEIIEAYEANQETQTLLDKSKTIFDVAVDIASGNAQDRFMGIRDYRNAVANAVRNQNYAQAETTLKRVENLRQRLLDKLANPNPLENPERGITDKHSSEFVKQLAKEINALTNTMRLLDSITRKNFNQSPLTAEALQVPTINVYKEGPYTGNFKGGVKATREGKKETVTPTSKPEPKAETKPKEKLADKKAIEDTKAVAQRLKDPKQKEGALKRLNTPNLTERVLKLIQDRIVELLNKQDKGTESKPTSKPKQEEKPRPKEEVKSAEKPKSGESTSAPASRVSTPVEPEATIVEGYHFASSGIIDEKLKLNKKEGALFFFKKEESAKRYGDLQYSGRVPDSSKIFKGKITFKNPLVVDATDLDITSVMDIVIKTREEGVYDGVILENMTEFGAGVDTQYAVFTPKKTVNFKETSSKKETKPVDPTQETPSNTSTDLEDQINQEEETVFDDSNIPPLDEDIPPPTDADLAPFQDFEESVDNTPDITQEDVTEQTIIPPSSVEGFQEFLDTKYDSISSAEEALESKITLVDGSTLDKSYLQQLNDMRNLISAVQGMLETTCDV